MDKLKPKIIIGIDPGIVCGVASKITSDEKFVRVESMKLHQLFSQFDQWILDKFHIEVYIENPNTWVPFKNVSREVMEMKRAGAGAVKQTYKHIIEFLEDNSIPYHPTRLQGNYKKVTAKWFKQQTGWGKPTNEHGRDAGMLIFGR
jgi:hypothetical protein